LIATAGTAVNTQPNRARNRTGSGRHSLTSLVSRAGLRCRSRSPKAVLGASRATSTLTFPRHPLARRSHKERAGVSAAARSRNNKMLITSCCVLLPAERGRLGGRSSALRPGALRGGYRRALRVWEQRGIAGLQVVLKAVLVLRSLLQAGQVHQAGEARSASHDHKGRDPRRGRTTGRRRCGG